jgi:excisionase family DNA binding protein
MAWLTISEAARRVGKSEATIYAWIRAGHIEKHEMVRHDRLVAAVIEKRLLEADAKIKRGRPPKISSEQGLASPDTTT